MLDNETILFKYNVDENGNPVSIKVENEQKQVSINGNIQMEFIPDEFNSVSMLGENNKPMYEVFNRDEITANTYYVDYSSGVIYYDKSQFGKVKVYNYYGKGIQLIGASRIYDENSINGQTVIKTIQDLIDEGRKCLELIKSLGDAVVIINKLDQNIKTGTTLHENLVNDINIGTPLDASLKSNITKGSDLLPKLVGANDTATQKKQALDTSITQATNTNEILTNTNQSATQTNLNLRQSIGEAQEGISKITATGNKSLLIGASNFVNNQYTWTHNMNADNLIVSFIDSDTNEPLMHDYKIIDKNNILIRNSAEHPNIKVILSASFYQGNALFGTNIEEFAGDSIVPNAKKVRLKDGNGIVENPITDSDAVFMSDGTTKLTKKINDINASLEQNNDIYNLEKNNLSNFYNSNESNIILCGIDSLSNGASGSKYLDFLAPRLRGELGDGGIGYCAFDIYSKDSVENFSIGYTDGVENLSSSPESNDVEHLYSFDLKGVRIPNGNGTNSINIELKRKFEKVKIVYLKQPNGGSFNINFSGSEVTQINTLSESYDLGVLELNYSDSFTFSPWGNVILNITNIIGKVCVYGGIFTNSNGVALSPIGRGGNTLTSHSNLDKTFFNKWLSIIKPKLLIFNGGTNDDLNVDYKSLISSYLQPYIDNNCNVLCIRPNVMETNEKWEKFDIILQNYCKEKKLGYLSEYKLFGKDYLTAFDNGFMADGVHPSTLGNKKRANNILSYLNIPIIGNSTTLYVGKTLVQEEKKYITQLKEKNIVGHSTQVYSTEIYRIGLNYTYNGQSPKGIIELKIFAQIEGSDGSEIKVKKVFIPIWNLTTEVNKATTDNSKIKELVEYPNDTFDFNITTQNQDGKVSILLNTTYYGWVKYTILATSYVTIQNQDGKTVFEN